MIYICRVIYFICVCVCVCVCVRVCVIDKTVDVYKKIKK